MVQDAVRHRRGDYVIAQHLPPFRIGLVGDVDHAASLVLVGNESVLIQINKCRIKLNRKYVLAFERRNSISLLFL